MGELICMMSAPLLMQFPHISAVLCSSLLTISVCASRTATGSGLEGKDKGVKGGGKATSRKGRRSRAAGRA